MQIPLKRMVKFKSGDHENAKTYWSPNNDEGIPADEVKIGEGRLYEGKSFLYLFDFGSEWHFKVTVQAINADEKPPKEAKIVESVGESPNQYDDWEEEDDE